MRVTLGVDHETFAPGDTVGATLEVVNEADTTVVLRFATSQRYDLALRNEAGSEVWRWSEARGFLQMMGEERVEAGRSRRWQERLPAPEREGVFTLEGRVTSEPSLPVARVELRVEG